MEKQTKVIAGVISAAVVGLLAGGVAGAVMFPNVIEVPGKEVIKTITVDVPYIVEKNVTVEVPVEKIVNVSVDNGKLSFVCQRLEDKAVVEDAATCVAELDAEDKALELAIAEIKDSLASEMEDADIVNDEDDIEVDKVYSEYDQVEFKDSDFDNNEYTLEIEAKVTDDDIDDDYKVLVTVDVEDSVAKIKKVEKLI